MAGLVVTPTSIITETSAEGKIQVAKPNEAGEPVLDDQGNVIKTVKKVEEKKNELPPSFYNYRGPLELAREAARLDKPVPTAGQYAIEHGKGPKDIEYPPECYLYDEDRPWVLGKLNKAALDVPEPAEPVPLPKNVMDYLDALEAAANARMKANLEGRPYTEEIVEMKSIENGAVGQEEDKSKMMAAGDSGNPSKGDAPPAKLAGEEEPAQA